MLAGNVDRPELGFDSSLAQAGNIGLARVESSRQVELGQGKVPLGPQPPGKIVMAVEEHPRGVNLLALARTIGGSGSPGSFRADWLWDLASEEKASRLASTIGAKRTRQAKTGEFVLIGVSWGCGPAGAATYEPKATPWELERVVQSALKVSRDSPLGARSILTRRASEGFGGDSPSLARRASIVPCCVRESSVSRRGHHVHHPFSTD